MAGDSSPRKDFVSLGLGTVRAAVSPPSQHPPLHLQLELPWALLDLVLCLHVQHLGRVLPIDGGDDVPCTQVTRGCLPVLCHLHGEEDMGTALVSSQRCWEQQDPRQPSLSTPVGSSF